MKELANNEYNPDKKTPPKKNFSHVKAKVGSLENKNYVSKGGKLTIPAAKKLNFSSIKPKVKSFENINFVTRGGNIQTPTYKYDYSHVKSKIGSLSENSRKVTNKNFELSNKKLDFTASEAPLTPRKSSKIPNFKIPDYSNIKSKIICKP
jgi:hypothetical protein